MEDERQINWLSLFIKIIIIFIFAIILIWLVSKIINSSKPTETFKNNINNMEEVAASALRRKGGGSGLLLQLRTLRQ